ncbi:hypothetical protein VTL71DRAFT_13975 [Oculimacula yallundae]|uniref:Heterokaryon incompatibility domain-containing protein n=1 Tax=Oculimacula yallundae TaxID=86028 RepID=A0ABR4CMF1_9HELO
MAHETLDKLALSLSLAIHDEEPTSSMDSHRPDSFSSDSDNEAVDLSTSNSPSSIQLSSVHDSKILQIDQNPFIYSQFTSPESEIRLIRILPARPGSRDVRCEIFHTDLDSAPPFKALSYAWGNLEDPEYQISLNACAIAARENLYLALQHLHAQPAPVTMWIDALCINQSDTKERNEQVMKMKTIYEQAEGVVVWLGPSYQNSHLAFQLMNDIYTHRKDTPWINQRFKQHGIKNSLLALHHLLCRDYWKRMWVCQELTVAKCGNLHCGKDVTNLKSLDETQRVFYAMGERDGYENNYLFDLFPDESSTISRLLWSGLANFRQWQQAYDSQSLSFFQCLLYNNDRKATDPKDMVYGLAALANATSKYSINIDYSRSVNQIYTDLARRELEHCESLELLTRARVGPNIHHLPSWVPDWSRQSEYFFLTDAMFEEDTKYHASGDCVCDVYVSGLSDIIFLKGVTIGRVEILGEDHALESRDDLVNLARTFLSWWTLLGMTGSSGKQRQEKFGRTLSCDTMSNHRPDVWDRGEVCRTFIAMFGELCEDLLPGTHIDRELAELKRWMHSNRRDGNTRYDNRTYLGNCAALILNRRLFLGLSGMMGLAPKEAIEGDTVCIPLGCPVPMIFRKVGDHYVIIGDAYVDGYMNGEAMEMLEEGELKLETFKLH